MSQMNSDQPPQKKLKQPKLHFGLASQTQANSKKICERNNDFGTNVDISVNPKKDGNCQFNCIESQLKTLGLRNYNGTLRAEVAAYIRKSEADEQGEVMNFLTNNDLRKYLEELTTPGTFGDNITLVAIAKLFNAQILVVSSLGNGYHRIITPDDSDVYRDNLPTILLGHYGEDSGAHYVCLSPRDGHNVGSIMQSRLSPVSDKMQPIKQDLQGENARTVSPTQISLSAIEPMATVIGNNDVTVSTAGVGVQPSSANSSSANQSVHLQISGATVSRAESIPGCWSHIQYMYFKTENP